MFVAAMCQDHSQNRVCDVKAFNTAQISKRAFTMTIKPITGMLRRNLVMDLSIALGLGFVSANAFWYGYHMPRTNARDEHMKKLEDERAARRAALAAVAQ